MRAFIRRKKIFSYYTIAKSPSTTFLYLWGSFTTTSTFLSLSSSNTFRLFSIRHHLHPISLSPPPPHTHTHYQHIYILFHPPHFVCFPCTTTSTTILLFSVHYLHHHLISIVFHSQPPTQFLWFLIRYIHRISILSLHHYLHHIPIVFHPPPRPPFCCFPSTTLTTFLFLSSSPSINNRFQKLPLLHHHPLIFMFS